MRDILLKSCNRPNCPGNHYPLRGLSKCPWCVGFHFREHAEGPNDFAHFMEQAGEPLPPDPEPQPRRRWWQREPSDD